MEKSEVIQKIIFTFRLSENIKFYIFTSENIKYTIYFINIFLYFTTLYIINTCTLIHNPSLFILCNVFAPKHEHKLTLYDW